MAVYRPTYRDKRTKEPKESKTWWFEFTIAGRRIRESAKTTRRTIAEKAEDRRRLELERAAAGLPVEENKPSARVENVKAMLATYKTIFKTAHRPRAIAWVEERSKPLERLLGTALRVDLTETRVREYMAARLEEKAGNRTVNMEVEILSRAAGHQWRQLWPKLKRLEEREDVGRALSEDEQRAVLQAAKASRSKAIYPAIRLALITGMRGDEIRSLRWGDVDLTGATLTVGRSKTKAGRRAIPLNADLLSTFKTYAAWYTEKLGLIQKHWYVFPFSSRVKPVDPERPITTLKSSWTAIRDSVNVQCRFHDLRHTALTRMAENGVPESTMLALAGHMSRAMLERYSHIRMAAKRDAMDRMTLPELEAAENAVPKESPKVRQFRPVLVVRKKAVNN